MKTFEKEYKRQFERLTKYISEQIQDPDFYTASGLYNKRRKLNLLLEIKSKLKAIRGLDKAFVKEFEQMYRVNVENVLQEFEKAGIEIRLRKEFTAIDDNEIARIRQSYLEEMKAESQWQTDLKN